MRFIKISIETEKTLKKFYNLSTKINVRQRAQAILLSNKGLTVTELINIFEVTRATIYNWFNLWESKKLVGLYDNHGKGRKSKLTAEMKEQVIKWTKKFPKKISKVCELIYENYGIKVSKRTIKRILNKAGFTWRRIRKTTKRKNTSEEYNIKKTIEKIEI